jgi:hypothetical protein
MTRRKAWLWFGIPFTLINLLGGVYAIAMGEPLHAGTHVVLLVGAYWWWRRATGGGGGEQDQMTIESGAFTDRLSHVEQSVDGIAEQVQRIGEGQRFITSLFTEKGQRTPGKPGADPSDIKKP